LQENNPLARPYRALTIGMVSLVSIVAFEAVAVTTAMPTVVRSLNGLALYGLAFGGALAAGIVGLVVSGELCDRIGPVRPIWAGAATFAAGLVLAGLAPAMWVLVIGRIVQGFGGGLITVALYVVIARAYPERYHPRVFTANAGAWVVPLLVGPYFAGLTVEHIGWRWVFLSMLFIMIPALLLVRPALSTLEPADTPAERRPSRAPWALGAALAAGLLYVGGQSSGAYAIVLMVLGLVGLVVCARRLVPRGTFSGRRGLPTVIALRGLAGSAFIQTDVFLPLLLSRERGLTPSMAGLTVTAGGLAWTLGSWLQGRYGQRFSPQTRALAGISLIATGVVIAALCIVPSVPVWVCVGGWAVSGLGMGLLYPTLSARTLQLSAPSEQGANTSALQLSEQLFATTVLALGGSLFALLVTQHTTPAYLSAFGLSLLLALLGIVAAAHDRVPAPESTADSRLVSEAWH
jgi:MFS family permease